MSAKGFGRSILLLYIILLHVALGYLLWPRVRSELVVQDIPSPPPVSPLPSPALMESPSPVPVESIQQTSPTVYSQAGGIIIPVAGVRPDQLIDTYSAARGEGRSHDAIDIAAPEGTPVLAAVSGEIARLFDSVPGGITIYQFSEDRRFVYYYAHLSRRSDTAQPGARVTQGTVIGYVGNTGNAGPNNFHLHFSISRISDPKAYWHGEYLNPFPLLKSGTAPQ